MCECRGGGGGVGGYVGLRYNYQDIDVRLVHSAQEYLRYEVLLYLQTFSIGTVVVGACVVDVVLAVVVEVVVVFAVVVL